MRVLIDYRPALRDRSGVGESTHQLASALLSAFPRSGSGDGLDLTLFSSSWKDRLTLAPELAAATTVDRRIPVRLLNFAWHRLGWPPAEVIAGGAFDVVHSPHPLLLPARRAAQVVTIHDLHFLERPEHTAGEIRRDYAALVRAHAHRAHRVLAPSRYTAQGIERYLGVPPARISICPHGAPDWPARASLPPQGYVLFVGTLEPRKNVGGLLDAYERLRNPPPLVLAGTATDAARAWQERIGRPPLAGRVRVAGYVDPSERYALYAGARLLVLPSFDEGFGLPVLEAMTVGVPVVASDRGALPEVVGEAGQLVDPDRPDALAAAIERVLEDDDYAARCVAAGVVRARAFSWRRTAHLVHTAYQRAIEQRASGYAAPGSGR